MENRDDDEIIPGMSSDKATEKKKLSIEKRRTEKDEDDSDSDSDSTDSDSEYICTVCDIKFSGYIPLKQHKKGSKHKKALNRARKARKILDKESSDDDDEEGTGHLIQEPFAICEKCNKEFSGPENYHLHLKSKIHKQKVLQASILEQVKENGEINVEKLKELFKNRKSAGNKAGVPRDGTKDAPDSSAADLEEEDYDEPDKDEFECKVCEKAFSGLTPYAQHLTSKTHERQVEKEKLLRKIVPDKDTKISDVSDVSSLTIEDDIMVCISCSMSFSGPESAILHLKSRKHAKNFEKYLKKLEKKKKKKELESKEAESASNENKADDHLEKERDVESLSDKDDSISNPTDNPEDVESASLDEADDDSASGGKAIDRKYSSFKRAMKSLIEDS